jgi:hypothetical protein
LENSGQPLRAHIVVGDDQPVLQALTQLVVVFDGW